ncbi:MAG: DUF4282 domain-containing protein [Alphaproteobacteria bacterium]
MKTILSFFFDIENPFTRSILGVVLKTMSILLIAGWIVGTIAAFITSGVLIGLAVAIFGFIATILYVALVRLALEMYFNLAEIRETLQHEYSEDTKKK